MKIRTISIIAAAIGIFMAVGCKKESEGITLGASIANDDNLAKVHLSSSDQPLWDNGDSVWVNGDATRTISDISNTDGTNAKIKGVTTSSSYLAIYPAGMATGSASSASIIIPATQSFEAGKIKFPMVAYSNNKHLFFYNLCSLIKVTVDNNTNAAFDLKKIIIKANNNYLSGTATLDIDANNETVAATGLTSGYKTVTLKFPANTTIAAGGNKECYIAVAPFATSNDITITVYTSNNKKYTRTRTISSLNSNTIASAKLNVDVLENTGYFTVNTTSNLKVRFSPGNLQYKSSSNNDNGTFRFAEHQYDYVGSSIRNNVGNVYVNGTKCNNVINGTTNGSNFHTNNLWIDLFGWGTSGHNRKGCYANTTNTNYGNGSNPISGTNYDWGRQNSASLGNGTVIWRTLTQQEWNTLLTGRGNKFPLINNTQAKYLQVRLTDVTANDVTILARGVIIFPDDFEWPESIPFPTTLNTINVFSSSQQYTLAQWSELEEAGAIYLPITGYRSGVDSPTNNTYSNLYYWSATNVSNIQAYDIYFACNNSGSLTTNESRSRSNGCAVRLVTDVQ